MKTISFIDIQVEASNSECTLEEFSLMLWVNFLDKKSKPIIKNIARELNIYPTAPNVYEKVIYELTKHIL